MKRKIESLTDATHAVVDEVLQNQGQLKHANKDKVFSILSLYTEYPPPVVESGGFWGSPEYKHWCETWHKYTVQLPNNLDQLTIRGDRDCKLVSDFRSTSGLERLTQAVLERTEKVIVQDCLAAVCFDTKDFHHGLLMNILWSRRQGGSTAREQRPWHVEVYSSSSETALWKQQQPSHKTISFGRFIEACSKGVQSCLWDVHDNGITANELRLGLDQLWIRTYASFQRLEVRHLPEHVRTGLGTWQPVDFDLVWTREMDEAKKWWTLTASVGVPEGSDVHIENPWPFDFWNGAEAKVEHKMEEDEGGAATSLPPELQTWLTGARIQLDLPECQKFYANQAQKYKKWPKEQQEAVGNYCTNGFQSVWSYCDQDFQPKVKPSAAVQTFVDMFDSADFATFLPVGACLFEGQGQHEDDMLGREWKVGDVFIRRRVTSTSWHPVIAYSSFTSVSMDVNKSQRLLIVHRIRHPHDIAALLALNNALEKEIIMTHHLQLTITHIEERRFLSTYNCSFNGKCYKWADRHPFAFRVLYVDTERFQPMAYALSKFRLDWNRVESKSTPVQTAVIEAAQQALLPLWRNPIPSEKLAEEELINSLRRLTASPRVDF